jgi:hypothetical protein
MTAAELYKGMCTHSEGGLCVSMHIYAYCLWCRGVQNGAEVCGQQPQQQQRLCCCPAPPCPSILLAAAQAHVVGEVEQRHHGCTNVEPKQPRRQLHTQNTHKTAEAQYEIMPCCEKQQCCST